VSIIADYFLIASGGSSIQVNALAQELDEKLSKEGVSPLRTEGLQSASWVIMDYGGVIVHIFHSETRKFYNLERLWADGKTLDENDLLA